MWREGQNVVVTIRSNMEVNKGMGVERGTLRGCVWGEGQNVVVSVAPNMAIMWECCASL